MRVFGSMISPGLSRRALMVGGASLATAIVADPSFGRLPRPGEVRKIADGGRSGKFRWHGGDQSTHVASDPRQGVYIASPEDPTGRTGAWVRDTAGEVRPEWFGAIGDGVANDSDAMAALARFVSHVGGGEVIFRKTTYLVGKQSSGIPGYAFAPQPLLEFSRCTRPLLIRGNGARLRCASGLRYGTFDPVTGAATQHPMPFIDRAEFSTPYEWMIRASSCSDRVEIGDLELDGNVAGHILGGTYGDTGRQIVACGIGLFDNSGEEVLRNVHLHHHALDGLAIDGVDEKTARTGKGLIADVVSEYNGRQGCSVTGGRDYHFLRSIFSHTGRSAVASAPGAGVDLEAEGGKTVRDISFASCTFSDNFGVGLVADTGDSARISLEDCLFVGTTSWSVWPHKPNMRFTRCRFAGAIVACLGGEESQATRFIDCMFLDDPALSPTGKLYFGDNPTHPVADLPYSPNTRFVRCRFQLTHDAVLPWSVGVIYEDCTMNQQAPAKSYPRGRFVGTNVIIGNVDLKELMVEGQLTVNGVRR